MTVALRTLVLAVVLVGAMGVARPGDANAPFTTTNVASSVGNSFGVPAVMELDNNNRAVFVYYKEATALAASGALWLYRCNNADCTTGTNTEIVASGVTNTASLGLAIDANNFAVVSYPGASSTTRILRCSDLACSGAKTDFPVTGISAQRSIADLELAGDLPAIVLEVSQAAKYVRCLLPDCSTGATSNTVSAIGGYFQLEFAPGGLPAITLLNSGMVMVLCDDVLCAAGGDTTVTIDATFGFGYHSSLVLNGTGRAFISYANSDNTEVRLAICPNPACSTASTKRILATGSAIGAGTAIGLKEGIPLVAYRQGTTSNAGTMLVHCSDVTCTTWETALADGTYANNNSGNTRPNLAFRNASGYYIGFFQRSAAQVRLLRAGPDAFVAKEDVDCTGTWEAQDALIIMRQLAGLSGAPLPVAPCDTDVDGTPGTSLGDVIFARRKAAGL